MWRGLFRSGPNALQDLIEMIEEHITNNGPQLPPLYWSPELAHAAADYLTEIEGS